MSESAVLYILPGLMCDESIFTPQKAGLTDLCEVRSPHFWDFDSITAMAQHVLDSAPPRFSLAGFSMGGRVALQIMRIAPERVERLCLFDTSASPEPEGGADKRKVLVELAYKKGMAPLSAFWLPPMLAPARRDDLAFQKPIRDMLLRNTPEQHEKQIKALVERPDSRDLLGNIKCPVMIICGAQDEWSTPAQHKEMADAIPGSELVIIENAGHFVSVEQPEEFTQLMRRFMVMRAQA